MVKNLPVNAGDMSSIPGSRRLPGESLWTEEPGGLQSMGSHKSRTQLSIKFSLLKSVNLFSLNFHINYISFLLTISLPPDFNVISRNLSVSHVMF